MVAGRRRWSATSDQARRWHTEWRQQQSGEDAEGEHEKISVSPIPTASNHPSGEAVHYTGGSLRGETSRDVMDTHTPPNNDHNRRSNSRNGNKNIRDGCEMGHDIRCTKPNRRSTCHRIFIYILSPLEKIWQIMYFCKRYYRDISFYKLYLNFIQSYVEAYKCFNIAKYIGKMSQYKRQKLFRAMEILSSEEGAEPDHLRERNLE